MKEIRDSEIARLIDAYEDTHPEPGPDEDSLRAYFAGQLHRDFPAPGRLAGYGAVVASVLIGAALALWLVWAVTG